MSTQAILNYLLNRSSDDKKSLNVSLSGSIVSLGSTTLNTTVTVGSTLELLVAASRPDYAKLGIAVYMASTYTYKIDVEYHITASAGLPIIDPVYPSGSTRFNLFTAEVKALTYKVFLTNLGSTDLIVSKAEVCGIKEAK